MSNYAPTNNFAAKAQLDPSDPDAEILGADFDTEFAAIQTAIATKYESADLTDQATAETGTNNTELMTPLRSAQALTAQVEGLGPNGMLDNWTFAVQTSDVSTTTTVTFDNSPDLSLVLTQDKTYLVIVFLEGNGKTSPTSGSGNWRFDYSNTPQLISLANDAFDDVLGGSDLQLTTSDDAPFTQSGAGVLNVMPAFGIIKASAVANTTITIEWQWGGVTGAGTWIKEGSWFAVKQLD